jgi:hypothetical protein
MKIYNYQFVPNAADELHCFQAVFRMAWEALTQESLSPDKAEQLTGFRDGMQTWPFAGMLAFAARGLDVRSIEDFRPASFIRSAAAEIRRQIKDDEVAAFVIEESDLAQEQLRLEQCVASDKITFDNRVPTFADLIDATAATASIPIVNLNYRALVDTDGYYGHFAVVDAIDDGHVVLRDPGPPPAPASRVTVDAFLKAWHSPNENAANLLVVTNPVVAATPAARRLGS